MKRLATGPGDPLAEQAFPDAKQPVLRAAKAEYADLFKEVWGRASLDPAKDVQGTYERVARSIAAHERSAAVNPYTSKFDLIWDNATAAGKDVTKLKWPGMGGAWQIPAAGKTTAGRA